MPIPLKAEGNGVPIFMDEMYELIVNRLRDLLAEGQRLLKCQRRMLSASFLERVARWGQNCRLPLNQAGSAMPDIVSEFRRLELIDKEYAGDVGVNLPPDEIVEGPNWRAIKAGTELIRDALMRLAPDSRPLVSPEMAAPRAFPHKLRPRWDALMKTADMAVQPGKAGFRTDLRRIVAVKILLPAFGSTWRQSLPDLCAELDRFEIKPPAPHSPESGRRPQPKTWAECLRNHEASVIGALVYARKQAKRIERAKKSAESLPIRPRSALPVA
jgi:hypothetical protein